MKSEPPTGDELTRLLGSMKRNVLERVAQEPAPSKRKSVRHIFGLGLGVAALLGVGAGAAFALGVITAPEEDAATVATDAPNTPSTESRPTAPATSEYAVTAGQPASRYGLDCGAMVDPSVVSGLFTTDVAAVDPILSESGVGIAIPRRAAILAVGGSVCEWSNGVPMNDQYGVGPDYVGVTISVVPRPAAGWSEYATQHGMPADESQCEDTWCWASSPVGDAWVTISAYGGGQLAGSGWQSIVDATVAAVGAAGSAAATTIPERMTLPASEDCDAVIPLDQVRSITATPDAQAIGRLWGLERMGRGHAPRGCLGMRMGCR